MLRSGAARIGLARLLTAGLRRSWWQNGAAALVALVAAGALFGVLVLTTGMERVIQAGIAQLGAHLVVLPAGQADVGAELLRTGEAGPLPASFSTAEWRRLLKEGRVIGILESYGWDLSEGGAGRLAEGDQASLLLIRLENWASPIMAVQEVMAAIPEVEVVEAEQSTRHVARYALPMVRYVGIAAMLSLLGAVLMTGLLTAIRVAERRAELGMMRAVGATRAFLLRLTLAEAGLLTLVGAVCGLLVAVVAGFTVDSAAEIAGRLTTAELLLRAGGAVLGTTLVGVLAALGPAWRAAALDPLEAVRRGR